MSKEPGGIKSKMRPSIYLIILAILLFQSISLLGFAASGSDPATSPAWITKTADKASYGFDENVTYTITFGNKGNAPVDIVSIIDYIPNEVEILFASPRPTSQEGNILEWDYIPDLNPGEKRSIIIEIRPPGKADIQFQEAESASGKGFVSLRKKLSTIGQEDNLNHSFNSS